MASVSDKAAAKSEANAETPPSTSISSDPTDV